ncbi:thiol oxidase [Caerostris darwini]|uniref:Sulfhydryl oxidase n=1 Tax=Caerostris darwini TaxID=1538125 RepID=A0AAV4PDQ2_9ARAC|nr:thiol oxidase [Caerostris darwini]
MRHNTFKVLKRAHLGNVDSEALQHIQLQESDPFIHHTINLVTQNAPIQVSWNTAPFTVEFRSIDARQRLHQTVITFLLRLAAVVKEELYTRTFRKPESWPAVLAWIDMLKQCTFCIFTLLYNVDWTPEKFFQLDAAILDLVHHGRATALREYMQHMGITDLPDSLLDAERQFEKLGFLNVGQFGSFFWRLLHWMAEAVNVRKDDISMKTAIQTWRNFVIEPLYRILRCGICMMHLKIMIRELETQLLNESIDYASLWYDIHNRVNTQKFQRFPLREDTDGTYLESEYRLDADYMRQALSP